MNLSDPQRLRSFLGKYGIKAEKGLGQHFLCSSSVADAIVERLSGCQGILEIGPGPGVLTSLLAKRAAKLIAIELDSRMIEALKESAPKAEVRHDDALKANLPALLATLPEPRGVVGNLPYYITGPLLTRISEARSGFSRAVLMMQKEVAERVMAPPADSNRGSLSVYLQSQFVVKVVIQAPSAAFSPPPRVDSTVLEFITLPPNENLTPEFFRMLRLSFAQPRKTLVNNLVAGYKVDRSAAVEWLERASLDENVRSHMLTMDQWHALSKESPTLL